MILRYSDDTFLYVVLSSILKHYRIAEIYDDYKLIINKL